MNVSTISRVDYNLQVTIEAEKEPPRTLRLGDDINFTEINRSLTDRLQIDLGSKINNQYTKEDALREEWEARYRTFNLNDPDSWGNFNYNPPPEDDLNELLSLLEQEGGNKDINITTFQKILAGEANSRNLSDKIDNYQSAYEGLVISNRREDDWLKDNDNYMASQVRHSANVTQPNNLNSEYSLKDLIIVGNVSEAYQAEISSASQGAYNEVKIALNTAMIDMKTDKLISTGTVSKGMAELLTESKDKMREMVIQGANSALQNRLQAGVKEPLEGQVDVSMIAGIYNKVMDTYKFTGGDAVKAIYEGAVYSKDLVTQAHMENAKVTRYENSMPSYLEGFFSKREPSPLEIYTNERLGLATKSNSVFEDYADSFRYFLDTLQREGEDIYMSARGGAGIPSYGNPNILDDDA